MYVAPVFSQRADIANGVLSQLPPTSTGTYPHHELDRLSPAVRSGPSSNVQQYDAGRPGEELPRPTQVRYAADPQPNSWTANNLASITSSLRFCCLQQ